ncbi:MAG TPA: cyclic nucleotide-binding domain-containing protein [Pirellulales bacterium]|nr:cyclic nucleotide-binding domain-containing protein [Pirellulales bacterium]
MSTPLLQMLHRLPFTAALGAPLLEQVAQLAEIKRFAPNEIVFREGDDCHTLFVVAGGRVTLQMHVPGRGQVPILSLGAGEVLAWSAVLGDGRMTATARAVDELELIAVASKPLLAMCDAHPPFGYALMHGLALAISQRLVATRLQMLDVFGK